MSGEAIGWVYRHSPYTGVTFACHLAIADSVNDLHGNEFWMTQAKLAAKARVSRKSVNTALDQMRSDGYVSLIEDHSRSGHANRYRFEQPPADVVFDARHHPDPKPSDAPTGPQGGVTTGDTPPPGKAQGGVTPGDTRVSPHVTGGVTPGDTEPKGNPRVEPKQEPPPDAADAASADEDRVVESFEEFWRVYPERNGRKVGKADALVRWRKLSWEQRRRAWTGAVNLAKSDTLPKDAHRFLRKTTAGAFPFDDWQQAVNGNGQSPASKRYSDFAGAKGGLI